MANHNTLNVYTCAHTLRLSTRVASECSLESLMAGPHVPCNATSQAPEEASETALPCSHSIPPEFSTKCGKETISECHARGRGIGLHRNYPAAVTGTCVDTQDHLFKPLPTFASALWQPHMLSSGEQISMGGERVTGSPQTADWEWGVFIFHTGR